MNVSIKFILLTILFSNSISFLKTAEVKQFLPTDSPTHSKDKSMDMRKINYKKVEQILNYLLKFLKQVHLINSVSVKEKEQAFEYLLYLQDKLFLLIENNDPTTDFALNLYSKVENIIYKKKYNQQI